LLCKTEPIKISVVIPCYNERDTVAEIVSAVRTAPLPDIEIIVVDDGSTDGSHTVLKRNVEPIADRVIYHGLNRGKGAALRSGFAAATGDIILVQDADLEYNPEEYPRLLEPILSGKADVVFGRFRFAPYGRGPASRRLFLAHDWEQTAHFALKHVHKRQSHRHGNLLQSIPRFRHQEH
jgi:glycosyltransferase involved in cell wall biosynthesis